MIREGEYMNIVDVIIILLILACGANGFKRGVLKQLVTTVGFVIVVVLAFYLKNPLAEFLSLHLPFFTFGGNFANITSLNIILYQLISFILVVILLEAVLSVLIKVTGVIEKILKFTVVLGIPSKILGFIVGIIEGFIITFLILFFLRQPSFNFDIFDSSKLTNPILKSTPVLSQVAGDFVDTFNDLYELGNDYYLQEMDENEINLKSIDVMLEHKIITPDYLDKLIDNNKIEIVGIDSVINKYR
jgi:uncharacterized membrane protein required for colicin V production